MTSVKSLLSSSNCYCPSPKPRIPWVTSINFIRKAQGFKLKSQCSEFSNLKSKSLMVSKQKVIDVATPKTPVIRTLGVLDAYEDEYDGMVVDSECLPDSVNAFSAILQSSLVDWKLKGKKGIWLKIQEEQADLVPVAIKEGFSFHHADPGHVMLTYWLADEPCLLPSTATHQVGIGAFIMNGNREVLVVKEKKCPLRCSGIWKLPTGFIDKSEEIFSGAVREVKEETGIDAKFSEVVAFRHAHNVTFEKSDLFFICILKPLSFEINIDECEIEAAEWMPLDELVEQPFHQEDSMSKIMIEICVARCENHYHGFTARQLMSKFDDRIAYIYSGDLN